MRQEFDMAVESIFAIRNSEGYSFLLFIKRTLAQFNIASLHDSIDIVVEAYLRGVRLIEKGTEIRNPPAWLRKTAYNIIRELSRAERKREYSNYLLETHTSQGLKQDEPTEFEQELEYHLKAVWQAMHKISDSDRQLLLLKYFENKSWKEISEHPSIRRENQKTVGALRTRGSRIMEQLREIYHQETDIAS